jgi:hypothetical protein
MSPERNKRVPWLPPKQSQDTRGTDRPRQLPETSLGCHPALASSPSDPKATAPLELSSLPP